MALNSYIRIAINFILVLLAQTLLFKGLVVFEFAFCFSYIAFILLLPLELPFFGVMTIALFLGLSVDIFYDTAAIHAASSVLVAFIRTHYARIITPRGGYDTSTELTLYQMGWQWISYYLLPLIFIHHLVVFLVEIYSFHNFYITFLKAISSSIYTYIIVLIYLKFTDTDGR